MKKFSTEEQKLYSEVLNKYQDELLKLDGVRDLGIGYPMKGGELQTEQLSIIVYVVRKFKEEELPKEQIIPKELDGIPVDIIESNPVEQEEPLSDPLLGGIGISNVNLSARGTLGAIVRKNDGTDTLYGLTNWHVIKRKRGKVGDAIVQPAWKPNAPNFCIGHLRAWNQELDCAVFELSTQRQIHKERSFKDIQGVVGGIVEPFIGLPVQKSGARTGATFGVVSFLSRNMLNVTIVPNPQKPANNNEISKPGDSGSLWVTDEDAPMAVALHHSGDGEGTRKKEFAYARNIRFVSKEMGFTF